MNPQQGQHGSHCPSSAPLSRVLLQQPQIKAGDVQSWFLTQPPPTAPSSKRNNFSFSPFPLSPAMLVPKRFAESVMDMGRVMNRGRKSKNTALLPRAPSSPLTSVTAQGRTSTTGSIFQAGTKALPGPRAAGISAVTPPVLLPNAQQGSNVYQGAFYKNGA